MQSIYRIKLALCVMTACALVAAWSWRGVSAAGDSKLPAGYELPFGTNPFAPSNAQTSTGRLIAQSEFIPAARCASCHKATHGEWAESAHRNSFREPFYQANVEHLIRERDITVTRHCESCHNPVALFAGVLTKGVKVARPIRRRRHLVFNLSCDPIGHDRRDGQLHHRAACAVGVCGRTARARRVRSRGAGES